MREVDNTSIVSGVVQDSTGKGLPNLTVYIVGSKPKLFAFPQIIQEYRVKTDSVGAFSKRLAWNNGASIYEITSVHNDSLRRYEITHIDCPPQFRGTQQQDESCKIQYSLIEGKFTLHVKRMR